MRPYRKQWPVYGDEDELCIASLLQVIHEPLPLLTANGTLLTGYFAIENDEMAVVAAEGVVADTEILFENLGVGNRATDIAVASGQCDGDTSIGGTGASLSQR